MLKVISYNRITVKAGWNQLRRCEPAGKVSPRHGGWGVMKPIKHIIAIKEAERLEIKIRTLDDIIGEEDKSE